MLNQITIMGRMTRDPELRRTNSGAAVANFTIACDRDFGEKETDFIECVAWKNTAEFISKYFSKGRMIVISGRLQIRKWTDKDGNKRKAVEVTCDAVELLSSKKSTESSNQPAQRQTYSQQSFQSIDIPDANLPF